MSCSECSGVLQTSKQMKMTLNNMKVSICRSVSVPLSRSIWRTPLFYGVVDKMPLRAVITASCPADTRTQQPFCFFLSAPPQRSDQNTVLSSCMQQSTTHQAAKS